MLRRLKTKMKKIGREGNSVQGGGKMLSYKSLRVAVIVTIATLTLVLLGAMLTPGTQLGSVHKAAAQATGCDTCHDSWMPTSPGQACSDCHAGVSTSRTMADAKHIPIKCASCHEGADDHQFTANPAAMLPKVNYNQEVCEGCHIDQYKTFFTASPGRTYFGGSDGGTAAPGGWSKTVDFPYLNVLTSGHSSVLEGYEERGMRWAQQDSQKSSLPKAESDVMQSSSRTSYTMGISYLDANNNLVSLPAKQGTTTVDRSISTEKAVFDGSAWNLATVTRVVPAGTTVTTAVDAVNAPRYQVKTVVQLPDGRIYTSYDDPALNETARGDDPNQALAEEAKSWVYAALKAVDFDGLYYGIPNPAQPYAGEGYHWSSVETGMQCAQCHDPHTNKLRIIQKSLIEAIAKRGINPYSPTGSLIKDFNLASRQDQIIAVCGQCHSEQVGGYSANDRVDRNYTPWAKPSDIKDALGNIITPGIDHLYPSLFSSLQDWTHGAGIVPWQATEANARGFAPYGQNYPINAPLPRMQHPEAETFFNSTMYNAGATCTDCHSARITRFDGTVYTSHSFVSPIKLMDGFTDLTTSGQTVVFPPQNPCVKCHTTDTIAQSKQKIKDVQTNFNFVQERTQVALVNALKYINSAGGDQSANIQTYRRAFLRWDFFAGAENSMSFHNNAEATTEVANARIWVDAFIPWPLTPVNVRVTSIGGQNMTLVFYDQANNEQGFRVERSTTLSGQYTQVAQIPTPNGANVGDVQWTDNALAPLTTYFYRIIAYNAAGTSVPSIWASGTTRAVVIGAPTNLTATAAGSNQINLSWIDNANNETGFRIERAKDSNFSVELTVLNAGANATSFNDSGLTPLTTYYYRVFAYNANDTSAASNTANAITMAAPPNAPSNLVATSVGRNNAVLSWRDNSTNESGFYLERSVDGGVEWIRIASLGLNTTSYNDTGLARRTTYKYRVQAHNASGASAYSNIVTVKTK